MKRPNLKINLLSVGLLVSVAACGSVFSGKNPAKFEAERKDVDSAEANKLSIESLEVIPSSLTLIVGEKHSFKAMAHFSDDTDSDVTSIVSWSSEDEKIGTIDNSKTKGEFSALKPGSIKVTATYDADTKATASVKVRSDISLQRIDLVYNAQMNKNTEQTIAVSAIYSDGSSRDVSAESTFVPRKTTILQYKPTAIVRGLDAGSDIVDVSFSGKSAEASIEVLATGGPNLPYCAGFTSTKMTVAINDPFTLQVIPGGYFTSVTIQGVNINVSPYTLTQSKSTAGTYQYSASVTGDGGIANCNPITVIVEAAPLATCTLTGPAKVYAGDPITVTATGNYIKSAIIKGTTITSAPFSYTETAPNTLGVRGYTGYVLNTAGAKTNCNTVNVTIEAKPATCTPQTYNANGLKSRMETDHAALIEGGIIDYNGKGGAFKFDIPTAHQLCKVLGQVSAAGMTSKDFSTPGNNWLFEWSSSSALFLRVSGKASNKSYIEELSCGC